MNVLTLPSNFTLSWSLVPSSQSRIFMNSWILLPVLPCQEGLTPPSSPVLAWRSNSILQSWHVMNVLTLPYSLILSWSLDPSIQSGFVKKSWLFHSVMSCHEDMTNPFNLDFILKSCPFHLVWSYHVQHSFPISFDPKARIWINAQLSKEYVWLCHLQLDSLSSGFVINYLTILFLALSSMSWL